MSLACISTAQAQGTIQDDDAAFVRGPTPWDASPSADFTGVSQFPTDDHLFETAWAFRVQGDTREFFFPAPSVQDYDGAFSEHRWNDVAGRGLFQAIETVNVIDLDGAGGTSPSGFVQMRMTITNISADDLTIDVFHLLDLDVGGSGAGDSAVLLNDVPDVTIKVSDSNGDTGYYFGEGVDAFTAKPLTFGHLGLDDDAITNFDDGDLPLDDTDVTSGMQWSNRTIGPGGTVSYMIRFTINRSVLAPDLSISIVDSPDPVTQGQPLEYTVNVSNLGPDDTAPGVVVTFDPLPAGVTAVSTTGCDNDPLGYPQCQLGDIQDGASRQFVLRVLPGAGAPTLLNASATVSSPDSADPDASNNSASTQTDVLLLPDLRIVKTNDVGGTAVDIDGWRWTLTLFNATTADTLAAFAEGSVLLIDRLPNANVAYGAPVLTLSENVTGTAQCSITGFDLRCVATSAMTLPPGAQLGVSVAVLPQVLGAFDNPRVAGGCAADPDAHVSEGDETNNTCSDSVMAIDFLLFSDGFED